MPGHWTRADLNLFTVSSSVGTHLPTAVGTALASKLRGLDQVSIAYFGDGASSKADFHQALSFAKTLCLPVIFFCENNRYAISVPFERQSAVLTVADTGSGFSSASGPGIGLANVSARLAAQFGDSASLVLGNNDFGGATATIALPLSRAAVLQ